MHSTVLATISSRLKKEASSPYNQRTRPMLCGKSALSTHAHHHLII